MPSLNRPNAPNRLPSADFGDLFYKPRALRVSDERSLITTPSPLTTPAHTLVQRRAFRSSDAEVAIPSSPLASPRAFVPPRRSQHAERSSYRSSSSAKSGSSREIVKSSSMNPYAIEEEPIPLKTRTSSMSNKAREILGFSDIVHPSLSQHVEQSLSGPKPGPRQKHDLVGGLLELRVGRRGEDGNQSRVHSEDVEMAPALSTARTISRRLSDNTTIVNTISQITDKRVLPESPDSFNTISPAREGLYCRTKRALGLKHGPIMPVVEPRSRTPTATVLDRVTSTLRILPPRPLPTSTSAATSVSNLSIAARRMPRPGRRSIVFSSSSSVQSLLVGRPPAGTPEPEALYTSSDAKQYLSVDMTDPDAPEFLPSEARRINTPPLPGGRSGKRGTRGFFFDYNVPACEPPNDTVKQTAKPTKADRTLGRQVETDWYRSKLDTIDSEGAIANPKELVSSIPDHLPNSPLCPRNPKHKSGGTGTCPSHGRNESTPSEVDTLPTMVDTSTLSPVPKTWWLKDP